jgi:putative membrane protein
MFDGYYYYGHMAGMHAFWWIFWGIFIVALLFWRRDRWRGLRGKARETPHDVLRRRLANGEITPEDYESRKAILDRDDA